MEEKIKTRFLSAVMLTLTITTWYSYAPAQMHQENGLWLNDAKGNIYGNSQITPEANPNINPMANPAINPNANPDINPMANPDVNPMANPIIAPIEDPSLEEYINSPHLYGEKTEWGMPMTDTYASD